MNCRQDSRSSFVTICCVNCKRIQVNCVQLTLELISFNDFIHCCPITVLLTLLKRRVISQHVCAFPAVTLTLTFDQIQIVFTFIANGSPFWAEQKFLQREQKVVCNSVASCCQTFYIAVPLQSHANLPGYVQLRDRWKPCTRG